MYHTVAPSPLPHVAELYPHKAPDDFERDLRWIVRHLHPVSYERWLEARRMGKRLPPRAALVTFDDGMAECFSVVRPLLLAYGVPCVFFLTAGFLDNRRVFYRHKVSLCLHRLRGAAPAGERASLARRLVQLAGAAGAGWGSGVERSAERWLLGLAHADEATMDAACAALGVDVEGYLRDRRPYLTTEQARTLAADGFTLGGHGLAHARLGALADDAAVEREIAESCAAAAALSGRDEAPFAFPFHGDGVGRDLLAAVLARHRGIGTVFDTDRLRPDRPFVVHRIGADTPPRPGDARSTLPYVLREAYRERVFGG